MVIGVYITAESLGLQSLRSKNLLFKVIAN